MVLILIAADAMAAIFGINFGSIRIYRSKTLQGLLAFIATVYCFMILLNNYYGGKDSNVLVVAIACGVTEIFSGNADNVTTLLVYWLLQSTFSNPSAKV